MNGTIDLELLALFATVAEARSFSAAAQRLHLPRSSVSRRVMRLEAQLGAQLLHRTTRKVALSPAGAALYERAAPHLAALRQAVGTLPRPAEQPSGLLRLTAPNDLGQLVLGELVSRFVARYPAVKVDVQLTTRQVDLMSEGFDLALRGSGGKRLGDSSLTVRRLGAFEGQLHAAPSYLARRGEPRSLRELAGHEWVIFRGLAGPLRFDGPGESLPVTPSGRIVADDFLFVREAVLAGAGLGVFDRLFTDKEVAAGRLVRVLPRHVLHGGGGLWLAYPATRHLPRTVAAFRDFVLDTLKALPR